MNENYNNFGGYEPLKVDTGAVKRLPAVIYQARG